MLHHIIFAASPSRVAEVFGELMNGQFLEFSLFHNAYIAIAENAHGT